MASRLPRVRRVGGNNRSVVLALAATVIVLTGVLVYLLLNGGIFDEQPRSALERDYDLLVQGLRNNPGDPATLMSLAEVEFDMGNTKDAFEHAHEAVKNAEKQPFFNLRLATLYVRDGRLDQAEKYVRAEIAITGTSKAEPYFLLAQILAENADYDDAIKAMQTGLRIDPAAADMGIVYAQILEKSGRRSEAIENYKKALKFLPGNEEAIAGLRRLGVEYSEPTATPNPHGAAESGDAR